MKELKTARLVLRGLNRNDAAVLYRELGCDPEITRYTGWNPYSTLEEALEKVEEDIANYGIEGCYSWIIQLDGEAVGSIGAYGYEPEVSSVEIGYSIFRKAWGKGYASEAAAEVVRFLLEDERINRVHAWSSADNAASVRVLEKAGLKREGLLRQAMLNADGSMMDRMLFGIVREDWSRRG